MNTIEYPWAQIPVSWLSSTVLQTHTLTHRAYMFVFPSLPKISLCTPQAQQLNTSGTVAPTKADYHLFLEEGAHRRLELGFLKPSSNTSADEACRNTFPALSFESGARRL